MIHLVSVVKEVKTDKLLLPFSRDGALSQVELLFLMVKRLIRLLLVTGTL